VVRGMGSWQRPYSGTTRKLGLSNNPRLSPTRPRKRIRVGRAGRRRRESRPGLEVVFSLMLGGLFGGGRVFFKGRGSRLAEGDCTGEAPVPALWQSRIAGGYSRSPRERRRRGEGRPYGLSRTRLIAAKRRRGGGTTQ